MAFEALDAFVGDHFLRVVVPLNVLLLDRFYSPGAGFCGMLVRWVDANDVRAKCVSSNMRPGNEPLGIGPEMDSEMWAINNAIFLHHTPGAFLAFVGWYCGSTGFVRLGLALEIGENFLHYAQMLMTKIAPSLQWGPWALYPAVVWALLIAHHTLGFFGGPFSHFFLMEDVDFQFLVFLLLFAFVPQVLSYPLFPLGDMTLPGTRLFALNMGMVLVGFVTSIYSRFFLYIPIAYSLNSKVFASVGSAAGYGTAVPLILFLVFATLMVLIQMAAIAGAVVPLLKGKPAEEKKAALGRALTIQGMGPVGVLTHSKLGKFRAVGKALMLQKAVQKKKGL